MRHRDPGAHRPETKRSLKPRGQGDTLLTHFAYSPVPQELEWRKCCVSSHLTCSMEGIWTCFPGVVKRITQRILWMIDEVATPNCQCKESLLLFLRMFSSRKKHSLHWTIRVHYCLGFGACMHCIIFFLLLQLLLRDAGKKKKKKKGSFYLKCFLSHMILLWSRCTKQKIGNLR